MADPSALRRSSLLASGLVVALALLGCGGGDEDADPPASSTTTTEATTGSAPSEVVDPQAFCAEMERLDGERPESYVGSDEHVADTDALADVAPEEVRPAIERYRDFLASGAITDDPGSNETDSWPEEVQADIAAIQDYATAHC